MGKFATVVIDPPWDIELGWNQDHGHYPVNYATMSLSEIAAIPLQAIADKDCMVFAWTTQAFLPHTFSIVEQWGFRYGYTMTWIKNGGINPVGRPQYNSEFVIVGLKGSPHLLDTRAFNTAMHWPRGAHSEKPEGFYDLLRRVTPGPRLDIFGRRRIAGFESWGNEAPDGPALPDHYQQVLLDA